ncbi:hypothetical protein SAMD00019534_038760, partial [Acytostelium subglobosum LB1]|uniref:hypothetical protein n=1 Tax=Acytostelium subglobosum LB1 TaxID=1410327 RepID=UPI000644A3A2
VHLPSPRNSTASTTKASPRPHLVDLTKDEDNEDEDDDDITDPERTRDTVENEGGAVEMRDLNVDQQKKNLEIMEANDTNKRRLGLSLGSHLFELIKDYGKMSLVVLVTMILGIVIIFSFSNETWIRRNQGTINYFDKTDVTILTSVFFVTGLAAFTGIQFLSVYGLKRMIETKFYLFLLADILLFIAVPWGMWAGDQDYWYWMGDVLLLLVGFVSLSFVMGYLGKPYQTTKERLKNGLAFLGIEVLVAVSALLYGMFIYLVYSNFSNIAKVAWRLIVHSIYFEVGMMIPVRLLVTKQMEKKGVSIMHSLAVVHAQAHISTLGRMMISTINDTTLTVISVLLLNIGKMVFRSTVQVRDKYASKVLEKVAGTEHIESKKFVRAVGLFTEMIMENASIPTSAFTLWVFRNYQGLFYMPFPDKSFGIVDIVINVAIQLGIAIPFDIVTLLINERYFGMPLERAWKKMREKWLPFFGFLVYGIITMGMLGVIWMACRLPRFVMCQSKDVCSCMFVSNCEEFIKSNL